MTLKNKQQQRNKEAKNRRFRLERFSIECTWSKLKTKVTGNFHDSVILTLEYEQSLFFCSPLSKTRDTQMATRETDGARWERHEKRETTGKARENGLSRSSDCLAAALVSRISRLRRSRARALPLLNRKKKRDCSQSILTQLPGFSLLTDPSLLDDNHWRTLRTKTTQRTDGEQLTRSMLRLPGYLYRWDWQKLERKTDWTQTSNEKWWHQQ